MGFQQIPVGKMRITLLRKRREPGRGGKQEDYEKGEQEKNLKRGTGKNHKKRSL